MSALLLPNLFALLNYADFVFTSELFTQSTKWRQRIVLALLFPIPAAAIVKAVVLAATVATTTTTTTAILAIVVLEAVPPLLPQ